MQKPEDSQLELYYGGWSSSTGDADWALRPLFWSKACPPHLYNVGYYSNPEVDEDLRARSKPPIRPSARRCMRMRRRAS